MATILHFGGSDDFKVGTTANLPLITGTGGIVQAGSFGNTANTFTQGNDSRLSDARVASDVSAWAKAATKPAYTAAEVGASATGHTHTKSQITDFPTSMPASDVSAWAKASTKPSYTAAEVGASATGHTHGSITYSGVGTNVLSAYQTSNSYYGSSADWASYLILNHGDGSSYYHQMLRVPFGGGLQSQVMQGGSFSGWRTYLDSTNWSSYAQKPISSGTGNPSGGSSGDIYIKYT